MWTETGMEIRPPLRALLLNWTVMTLYPTTHLEITNAEYAACVDDGGCTAPSKTTSGCCPIRSTYYSDPAYANFPVIYVDWYKIGDYCTWPGG